MAARYKVRGTYRVRLKLRHFRRIRPPTPNITEKPGLGTPGYYLYYGLGTLFLRKSEDNVCYFNTANTGHFAEYKTPDFTALCLCVLGIHKEDIIFSNCFCTHTHPSNIHHHPDNPMPPHPLCKTSLDSIFDNHLVLGIKFI